MLVLHPILVTIFYVEWSLANLPAASRSAWQLWDERRSAMPHVYLAGSVRLRSQAVSGTLLAQSWLVGPLVGAPSSEVTKGNTRP